MNTVSKPTYKPIQKLHPLSLLAQHSSRAATGCLQISNGGNSWFLYLEKGQLVYASDLADPFGRLDRHLRRLSVQAPSLISAVRVQVRLLFETPTADEPDQEGDYRAICWLVEQKHITPNQAEALIAALAREVIDAFLPIQTGSYDLIEQDLLADCSKFCHLDLRSLVEECQQNQAHRRHSGITTVSDRFNFNPPGVTSLPKSLQQSLGLNTASDDPAFSQPSSSSSSAKSQNTIASSVLNTPQAERSPSPKTYTIACIDDSPTVLKAINSFLDDKSFSVVLISDPVKALMQIIRSKPDLILLDVTMPNLDGYELCSLLRKHPSFRATPIIMVTGNTGFIDRAKAKLVGSSGYLTKPFTQSDLIKMVFKHLS